MGKNKTSTDEKNKNDAVSTVFKIDMHCTGCVERIVKIAKSIDGVASVKTEFDANKLTVFGVMDPLKLKNKLELKTRKKVDLVSPQGNKKDKENKPETNNNAEKKDVHKKKSDEKPDSKKPKELQVMTATLKLQLHCQGCIEKINKVLSRTKGVLDKTIDKQKDQVTVKGTMDVKALVQCLKDRLRRDVEVVPAKKEAKKEKEGGDGNCNGGGDGNANAKKGKKKDGDGDGKGAGGGGDGGCRMAFMSVPGYGVVPDQGFGYPPQSQYFYGYPGYIAQLHAPQMFSDENPNACSIM